MTSPLVRIRRYGRSISEAVFFLAAAGVKLNWRQRAAWWAYRRWGAPATGSRSHDGS